MIKHIIREVEPEACDFSYYFDDDGLTEEGGDYCYTLFILYNKGWGRLDGFNIDEYKNVQSRAAEIIDGFQNIGPCSWHFSSYKECMEFYGIDYNSRKCHALKEWAKDADESEPEDVAAFLTITTGKKWAASSARGYCQGDCVEIVYCPENYPDGVEHYGEVWLGAAKEFCVIDVNENGEETETCYGYIVADCQAWKDEDYKRLVCEWAGIDEAETRLEMIDGYETQTVYTWRTA